MPWIYGSVGQSVERVDDVRSVDVPLWNQIRQFGFGVFSVVSQCCVNDNFGRLATAEIKTYVLMQATNPKRDVGMNIQSMSHFHRHLTKTFLIFPGDYSTLQFSLLPDDVFLCGFELQLFLRALKKSKKNRVLDLNRFDDIGFLSTVLHPLMSRLTDWIFPFTKCFFRDEKSPCQIAELRTINI